MRLSLYIYVSVFPDPPLFFAQVFRFHGGVIGEATGGLYVREQSNALWLQWLTNRVTEARYLHTCEVKKVHITFQVCTVCFMLL